MLFRIVFGSFDTRTNKSSDFAITPYLFITFVTGLKVIGFCWGFWACYIGLTWNLPSKAPFIVNVNKWQNK